MSVSPIDQGAMTSATVSSSTDGSYFYRLASGDAPLDPQMMTAE